MDWGVSYFAKRRRDAISVFSSRVRCDRIVEMRTRNGSSRSATIFASAVPPSRRSPAGRYRRERSRMMNSIRSRADAEVLKGLPRGVDRAGDQDDVLGIERAGSLRSACEDAPGERSEGPGHRPEVLVVQDASDEDRPPPGEDLLHRDCNRDGGRPVVGSVHDDGRILANDLEAGGPPDGGDAGTDCPIAQGKPGCSKLRQGRHRDGDVFRLERPKERRAYLDRSERAAYLDVLPTRLYGASLEADVAADDGEGRVHLAASHLDHGKRRLVDRDRTGRRLDDPRLLPGNPLDGLPEMVRVLEVGRASC